MKISILYMAAIALSFYGIDAGAQCAGAFNTQEWQCVDGQGCSSSVETWEPMESQDGSIIQCSSVDCCGQLFHTCQPSGECEPEGLKQPEFKRELDELVLTSQVLVQDCGGHYVPYDAHPTYVQRHGDLVQSRSLGSNILNEHLLTR